MKTSLMAFFCVPNCKLLLILPQLIAAEFIVKGIDAVTQLIQHFNWWAFASISGFCSNKYGCGKHSCRCGLQDAFLEVRLQVFEI